MDSERVNEIRARWEAVQKPVVQGLKMPPMAAMEAFSDNADDDVAFLLAENARLTAVADAAREFADYIQRLHDKADKKIYADDIGVGLDAYRDALAAFDAAEGKQ